MIIVGLELLDRDRDLSIAKTAQRIAGPNAQLLLLHVHPFMKTAVLDFVRLESSDEVNARVLSATERLRSIAKEIGGDVQVDVALGTAPDALIERARSASLLVIGRTHKGTVGRFFEGTIETRLAHESPCPLVIVP
jgi:nucleotide-binding universal stress UspA family protein